MKASTFLLSRSKPRLLLLVLWVCASGLVGCGQKGDLLRPAADAPLATTTPATNSPTTDATLH